MHPPIGLRSGWKRLFDESKLENKNASRLVEGGNQS
jgi:hypothetical protein